MIFSVLVLTVLLFLPGVFMAKVPAIAPALKTSCVLSLIRIPISFSLNRKVTIPLSFTFRDSLLLYP